ncbi:hypothetical protein Tco_0979705 [Tanacetum coccineum]
MSLVIAKANPDYVEARQATEEIETPSIGFAAPCEFKEGTIKTLRAIIKQNNTILYLLVKQGEEVRSIREELIEVKERLKELEKQEAAPQEFGEAVADLTKRLEKIGILDKTLPKSKQESVVNPEQQLAISGRRRAQLAPAEVLYSYNRQTAKHRVYKHYSEQRINYKEGDQVDL